MQHIVCLYVIFPKCVVWRKNMGFQKFAASPQHWEDDCDDSEWINKVTKTKIHRKQVKYNMYVNHIIVPFQIGTSSTVNIQYRI